jgi:streptogramin lyase
VLDSNGNGKRDDYTEPGQPIDAAKDMRITAGSGPYAVMPSPVDGSIWYTVGDGAGRNLLRSGSRLRTARW